MCPLGLTLDVCTSSVSPAGRANRFSKLISTSSELHWKPVKRTFFSRACPRITVRQSELHEGFVSSCFACVIFMSDTYQSESCPYHSHARFIAENLISSHVMFMSQSMPVHLIFMSDTCQSMSDVMFCRIIREHFIFVPSSCQIHVRLFLIALISQCCLGKRLFDV